MFVGIALCDAGVGFYLGHRCVSFELMDGSLRLGRDGEKVVGQYLEGLRANGAKVFHDIQGQNFNLDHVVIARSGIYVIETKTYSKPESGRPVIVFNGQSLKINGLPENDKSITQVTAAANWLRSELKESTGKQFKTKPVVVFPGWFIESTSEAKIVMFGS